MTPARINPDIKHGLLINGKKDLKSHACNLQGFAIHISQIDY